MNSNEQKMNAREAASYLGLAHATLAKMGGSPTFMRLGRKIVYCRDDLDAWLNDRRATSTSDADRLPQRLTEPPPEKPREPVGSASDDLQARVASFLRASSTPPYSR
jgi:hypothetical protein